MARGLSRMSAGWSTWKWLSGVDQKQRSWFLGVLQNRAGFESWMAHLTKGLTEASFLLRFEGTSDPWERSKIVGQRISELRASFLKMPEAERMELAKSAETELRTGLELMGKDKKTIQELIALVDPPST
jgi:hypothetical protein